MADGEDNISLLRRVNLVFRFSYTFPFFMASVCGSLFAFLFYEPPVHIVILMPLVVLLLAIFVNFSNDYFDHRSGVDKMRFSRLEEMSKAMNISDSKLMQKIYWEGNPFDNGLVTGRQGKVIMAVLVIASIILAIPIIMFGGLIVALFGVIGILLSYFYTAPPVDMGARGLGEVNVAASFFMLVFCSFYVATVNMSNLDSVLFSLNILDLDMFTFALGVFNWEIFMFAVIVGTLVGLMRLTDSMSGQEAHIANGEKSISVRFGLDGTAKIAKVFIVFGYFLFSVMTVFINPLCALFFLSLPLTRKAWRIMTEKKDDWVMKLPPLFFGTAFLTEVFFIIAVVIQWWFGIEPLIGMGSLL
ncbi:MAG: prenyltransferase [Methanomassiliicoccaceae archaeon]|jgi:1,4-dihydroxy-2-naphthoate octaprenyltransferase|nr:prenyltransferase [Methanomassiliicoccaceae archaeon]